MRNPKWLGRQQAATILAALLSLLIRKNNPRLRYASFWIRKTRVTTNRILLVFFDPTFDLKQILYYVLLIIIMMREKERKKFLITIICKIFYRGENAREIDKLKENDYLLSYLFCQSRVNIYKIDIWSLYDVARLI